MSSDRTGEAENRGGDVSAGKWGPGPVLEAALWRPRKEGGRLGQGGSPGHGGQNSPTLDETYKLRFQEAQCSPNQKLTAR